MNILHLKYAVEVEKTRSISKAAENLYMGQPNLSRAIKELEESLGITVFKRTTKGITITPDGEEFLRRARRIVSQVEEMEDIYRSGRAGRQEFSVCVPRADYFSEAIAKFALQINTESSVRILYKETDSADCIGCVSRGEFNLGVIRYQQSFEKLFKDLISSKKLVSDTICEFTQRVLVHRSSPLAKADCVSIESLSKCIEIAVPDTSLPSLPINEPKKTVTADSPDRLLYIYDRATQLKMLQSVPNTFMWVGLIPQSLVDKHELAVLNFSENSEIYKDVLIYRKDYRLSELDKQYITDVCNARRECR